MSRRTRSFFFDNKNGKLFTGISFTLKDIADEVEGVSDIDGTKVSDFARSAIQTSVKPFLDSDTVIMTAAATDDRIQVVTNSIIDSAPGALDTLNELAAALGDDANFSTTITNSLATKANTADLSTVATSGSYTDLTNKPSLAAVATSGAYADLTGKPTIPAVLTDLNITDGTNGQVLTTNGSGAFTFADASGGISNVVEDTTPQLGGNLDTSGYSIGKPGGAEFSFYGERIHTNQYKELYLSRGSLILTDLQDDEIKIKTPDNIPAGYTLTLPSTAGSSGQVLTTDGTGVLSFADASGGSSFTASLFHTLDNPNAYSTSAGDRFGFAVAISGNYAIVSTYGEDDAGGSFSGKAYIFDVTTGTLVATLDNPNAYSTSQNDYFGYRAVAVSGNYAIVGAEGEDDVGGSSSGKAYIFNVTTGALLYTLNNPNAYSTSASDTFGYSVAISGNYAIVGAIYEDDAGGGSSGKAYIFNVTTGALLHTLNNPNAYSTSANDQFGKSVAISGNYAIVGAWGEDDAGDPRYGGSASGKAYIFNVSTGALLHTLDNPNAFSISPNDSFGGSVAISGNYAIVGAEGEDDAGGNQSGKAYIFNVSTGSLVHTLDNPNAYSTSGGDNFGKSVAISGNYAIVGAYNEDDAGGTGSGKAYIFDVTTGTLVATLDNPNAYSTSASDIFGDSVAISGNYAIVGAYNEDDAGGTESGKAYIYQLPNAQPYVLDAAEEAGFSATAGSNNIGYLNIPAVGTKTSSYTLTTSDVGKYVQLGTGGSVTIPNSTFSEGDVVSIFNNTTGDITITCSITTAYIGGANTDVSSVTLATRGIATVFFISSTTCVINGNIS